MFLLESQCRQEGYTALIKYTQRYKLNLSKRLAGASEIKCELEVSSWWIAYVMAPVSMIIIVVT